MSVKLSSVSTRKIAANRQNSLKSTGPKTHRGKAHSRKNALKHGLFAMEIFMWDGAKRENQQQYQQLLDRLVESYQPVGARNNWKSNALRLAGGSLGGLGGTKTQRFLVDTSSLRCGWSR